MAHPLELMRQMFRLPPEEEQAVEALIEQKHFRRGERIEARHLMRSYGYYVVSGMARVFYVVKGREHTYSFALEDEYIMLSQVLLNDPDSITCIEFLEPTELLFLPHRQMGENIGPRLLDKFARETFHLLATAMATHLHYVEERMMMLQTAGAAERYAWMEQRYPRVLERATITQVASFLGVAKETLYRIRSKKYASQ